VVVSCGLCGLLVLHISLRYLSSTLFGFVTHREIAPVVPAFVLGIHSLLLLALAVVAAVRFEKSGVVLGTGLLLFAIEPGTSSFIWGDGCEVGGGGGASLLSTLTRDGPAVIFYTWNGACSISLNTVAIGIGVLLVGVGLWLGRLPEVTLSQWMMLLETYWPVQSSK
jgi:hypothetical protein